MSDRGRFLLLVIGIGAVVQPTNLQSKPLAAVGQAEPYSVSELYEEADALVGTEIWVEGPVSEIAFAPEFRDGYTVNSLSLSDGFHSVRVLNPAAVYYSQQDILRVRGVLKRRPSSVDELELDAREGLIEAIDLSERSEERWVKPRESSSSAIPVTQEQTTWSLLVGLGGILSGLFATATAGALLFRRRYFHLSLHAAPARGVESYRREGERLYVPARLFSTGREKVALAEHAVLTDGVTRLTATSTRLLRSGEPATFPILLGEQELEIEFSLPDSVEMQTTTLCLHVKDSIATKRFRLPLPWISLGTVGRAQPGSPPQDGSGGDVKPLIFVPGGSRYHSTRQCVSLRRTDTSRFRRTRASDATKMGLLPCVRCCPARE